MLNFSANPGFYTVPFHLKISSLSGDEIRFTTDGSIPTMASPIFPDSLYLDQSYALPYDLGRVPTTPKQDLISFKAWESPGKPLQSAHVIRCASFENGNRTSGILTGSYFVDRHILSRYSMPVISLVTDSLNLFDHDSGIYLPGQNWDPKDPEWSGNYFMSGSDWERHVHIGYFSTDGTPGFTQDAGLRIHGGLTRHAAQKTLRLYAREEYGERYFNYPLFPQKANREYKRFLLRTSMGSWGDECIIKDVLAHEIVRDLDLEFQDFQPTAVYINGEYWGIHTLRDRIDERYIEYTHGVDKDSVDMINGNYGLVDAGSNQHYIELAEYVAGNDLSLAQHYDHVASQIDMDNFIDYMIARMYLMDKDWPGNNQKLWRPQTSDGKWRWIFFDLDAGFDRSTVSMFEHAIVGESDTDWQNQPVSSFLLRNLLKNEHFVEIFLNRWTGILNHEFELQVLTGKLDAVKRLYVEELPMHMDRWNYPISYNSWERDIMERLYVFLESRSCVVSEDIMDYFSLSEFTSPCYKEKDISLMLKVAPNPTSGSFSLINMADESYLCTLHISDMYGRIVYVKEYLFLEELGSVHMDLPPLSPGIYHLRIMNELYFGVLPVMIMN